MTAAYDLHIHSCLSPCASNDMTPANIAGMAHIKRLSIISLTDHNSGCNLKAMAEAALAYGIMFIPGIEVTTREEVHILTYFSELQPAIQFGETIYGSLPDIKNRPEIFGEQIIIHKDNKSGTLDKLLLQASSYSLDDIVEMVKCNGGCAVPAHINRDSFSILSNLGFIPDNLFSCVEIAEGLPCPPIDAVYKILHSSDAHDLGSISEPVHTIGGILEPADFIRYYGNQ